MPEFIFPSLTTGWPLVTISVVLSLLGYLFRKPELLVLGGVLLIPFSWYLRNAPGYGILGPTMPVFLLGGAVFVNKRRLWIALMLIAVPIAIIVRYAQAILQEGGVTLG